MAGSKLRRRVPGTRLFNESAPALEQPLRRILVVDDESRILDFVSRGLQREGFSVDVAADGKSGPCRPYRGPRLDTLRREVGVGWGPIALAEREFVLLQEPMRHPGITMGKEQLLEAVWGFRFDPAWNVVDVCVRRLRVKVGAG